MYNSGNSSKNVTGSSIVDGTVETVDIADDAVTADKLANTVNTDIATGVSGSTTAGDALPKTGGAMTGAITTNSTFDGVDVATRDGVLTTTTTTANAALPKAGGTMTGTIADFTSTGIDDNATSTAITIDSSENVGIGVTSPTGVLSLSSADTTTNPQIRFQTGAGTTLCDAALSTTDDSGGTQLLIGSNQYYSAGAITRFDTSRSGSAIDFGYTGNTKFYNGSGSSAPTESMRIRSSGGVCVGNTVVNLASGFTNQAGIGLNPNGEIQAARNGSAMQLGRFASTGDVAAFRYEGTSVGGISVTGSATSYNTASDYRLKENVVPMTGSVDRLKALNPSRFNFISDATTTVDGFLAHEAGEVVPECATGTKDAMKTEEYEVTPAVEAVLDADGSVTTEAVEAVMGTREVEDYQGIDQSKLVPLLVSALQEAIARIETLENA